MEMKGILDYRLLPGEAALWWLGQSGYIIRSTDLTIAIDPYLSDAAAIGMPEFTRLYPPPFAGDQLCVDIYVVTHNHADHLDPETVQAYAYKDTTRFIAPRLACKKLEALGVPASRITRVDVGEQWSDATVGITGIFTLPTGADVLDTAGYLIRFANGRELYHTSDTQYHPLVVAAAPRKPEVMVVPINGKWGNTNAQQAAEFAVHLQPAIVIPNHYDMMALNGENPDIFRWFCEQSGLGNACTVASLMHPIRWSGTGNKPERPTSSRGRADKGKGD